MKFNKLVPELSVSGIAKSIEFYTKALGFKVEYQRDESKFAFLSLRGSQLMIEENNRHWETGTLEYPLGRGINFQMEVKSVDVLARRLEKHKYPLKLAAKGNWYRKGRQLMGRRDFWRRTRTDTCLDSRNAYGQSRMLDAGYAQMLFSRTYYI